MRNIALTGNIASGKSTVAKILAGRGALIIDADLLAREAVAPGSGGLAQVREAFGAGVISSDGTLDRAALRKLVFDNPEALNRLNGIIHPRVAALRGEALQKAAARGEKLVISDIPLLFETGMETAFEGVILVEAPEAMRLERLIRDRGLSAVDAQAMINAQWPSERKRALSTWVIENNGDIGHLKTAVDNLWPSLMHFPSPDPLPQTVAVVDTTS